MFCFQLLLLTYSVILFFIQIYYWLCIYGQYSFHHFALNWTLDASCGFHFLFLTLILWICVLSPDNMNEDVQFIICSTYVRNQQEYSVIIMLFAAIMKFVYYEMYRSNVHVLIYIFAGGTNGYFLAYKLSLFGNVLNSQSALSHQQWHPSVCSHSDRISTKTINNTHIVFIHPCLSSAVIPASQLSALISTAMEREQFSAFVDCMCWTRGYLAALRFIVNVFPSVILFIRWQGLIVYLQWNLSSGDIQYPWKLPLKDHYAFLNREEIGKLSEKRFHDLRVSPHWGVPWRQVLLYLHATVLMSRPDLALQCYSLSLKQSGVIGYWFLY